MGVVDRGAKDKAVRPAGFLQQAVDGVIPKDAGPFQPGTGAAADAVPKGIGSQGHDLGGNPLSLQGAGHLGQGGGGTALGSGAAVEQ